MHDGGKAAEGVGPHRTTGVDVHGGEHATAIVYVARRGPTIERWDGTSWIGVETPPPFGLDVWRSIFGSGEDEIMAVGRTAVRYDGAGWTLVNLGQPLLDVHGVGNERWAVGWNEQLTYGVLE